MRPVRATTGVEAGMERRGQAGEGADAVKFTEEEAQSILAQLNSGTPTGEIAEQHECDPSDIWALWDERNRDR